MFITIFVEGNVYGSIGSSRHMTEIIDRCRLTISPAGKQAQILDGIVLRGSRKAEEGKGKRRQKTFHGGKFASAI